MFHGPLEFRRAGGFISRISVQLSHLKAVFFVHDFDGGPALDSSEAVLNAGDALFNAGRRILVTFADGELLDGRTLNYSAEAPGFFVSPIDPTTNNQRIFVVNAAVTHVRFL